MRSAETLRTLSIPFEKLTTSEISRRYPQIGLDRIPGPSRAWRNPFWRAAVPGIGQRSDPERRRVFSGRDIKRRHNKGSFEPDCDCKWAIYFGRSIHLCVWSMAAEDVSRFAGPLRIHPTRQEVFFFATPAGQSFTAPALPTWIDFKDEAYGLPDLEGRGIKIAIDRHGPSF